MRHYSSGATLLQLGVVLLAVATSCQADASASALRYRAASTMHLPEFPSPAPHAGSELSGWAASTIAVNLRAYTNLTATARQEGAQIIVFPESGTGYLASGNDSNIPYFCEDEPIPGWSALPAECDPSSTISVGAGPHRMWASCMARQLGIDVVINYCTRDPVTGDRYNSNVAFSGGDGLFLAVYRKSHINAVPWLTQPAKPDPVVFESSFGVTFGMFICFDLWFQNPVKDILKGYNRTVIDFLYPNGMGSLAPLAAMDEIHAGFSAVHGANLVSAAMFPTGGAGVFNNGQVRVLNPLYPWKTASTSVAVGDVYAINRSTSAAQQRQQQQRSASSSAMVGSATSRGGGILEVGEETAAVVVEGVPCALGSCATFAPGPDALQFQLTASFNSPSVGNVSCAATVAVSSAIEQPSNHTWMLIGLATELVPASASSPDAAVAAACVVLHCDAPGAGCPLGAPYPVSMYESDLYLDSVSVTMKLAHQGFFATAGEYNTYPLYGSIDQSAPFPSPSSSAETTPWPFRVFDRDHVTISRDEGAGTFNVVGSDLSSSAFYSAGWFASAKGSAWPN